ncbi:zona pellucida sperm-binding protein 3-like [Scleropages formosus]|uniref:zona pellucida sperm-binding protein 3-like n=1 Tax=Scleropages formosus TaxID=113540 RepID=UPI0008791658|nr:zona pellucida sperm-binding protein 3-like [Scleropages formosus]
MQPVDMASQGWPSVAEVELPQRKPFQAFQGQSSWQFAPEGPMYLVPQKVASQQLLPMAQPFQPSVPTFPVQPVIQVPRRLPVHQVSLVQPSVQDPSSLMSQSQWLVAPSSVRVECREDSVLVEVQQDMLGAGQIIQPSEISLGGCAPTGQDPSKGILIFLSELQGCGSTLMMTDSLVYTFVLAYVPKGIGSAPIVRANGAVINIECHYLRRYNVSSNAVIPTWIPYSATMFAEEHLMFSLQLMTDNWQLERTSNMFFLGELLNIEASVVVANHQPLRVFVDSCVATLEPDVTSALKYNFVDNHGCLADAKLLGSRSQFLPRQQDNKLQMQLDAFRFSQDTRNALYITCILKATMASKRPDDQHKACSYSVATNRWLAADGSDQVCGCCDTTCSFRKGRKVADFQGKGSVGPVIIVDPYQPTGQL